MIRFNAQCPDGLIHKKTPGRGSKLTTKKSELAQIVEEGPARHVPDLIFWRRIALVRIVKKRFDVECHETTIGNILRELGFSHISPYSSYLGPQHPKQDEQTIEKYKKISRTPWQK